MNTPDSQPEGPLQDDSRQTSSGCLEPAPDGCRGKLKPEVEPGACAAVSESSGLVGAGGVLVMPRWKMLDVVWLDHYWRPRALIVGISRSPQSPNQISYDCVNEWEVTNYFRASDCLSEAEWRESIEGYLRDEYTPREWRKRMDKIAEFKEPPCWEEFRSRFRETGDPFLPWIINGKAVSPAWQIDQTGIMPFTQPAMAWVRRKL